MPEENHLVIGLGGTGGAVVRELHKKHYVEWSNSHDWAWNEGHYRAINRPDVYEFGDINGTIRVATLSIDSDEADFAKSADIGCVLGERLSIKDTERLLLVNHGMGQMLANLDRFPGVKPWVAPDSDQIHEITQGGAMRWGCQQNRRLGRLVLSEPSNLRHLIGKLHQRLHDLCAGGTPHATIQLCTSLSGGTGSGILLDTIAQIQKTLQNFPRGLSRQI